MLVAMLRLTRAPNLALARLWADALGVERSNLYKKMRAFGIAPSRRELE